VEKQGGKGKTYDSSAACQSAFSSPGFFFLKIIIQIFKFAYLL
jgi:hypothetical protein